MMSEAALEYSVHPSLPVPIRLTDVAAALLHSHLLLDLNSSRTAGDRGSGGDRTSPGIPSSHLTTPVLSAPSGGNLILADSRHEEEAAGSDHAN